MANLAIVGSHSTNGVAAIHSQLLRTRTVKDLAEMFPDRFSNKTNGVTPRRWLLLANPALARTITDAIGDGWITDLAELQRLKPLADDKSFRQAFRKAKRQAKAEFARWLKTTTGQVVDPETMFDCQVKRIHEYKRQLLNALRIVVLYNRLRTNPRLDVRPRTFLFGGKAAPAYQLAKLIIKFINNLAATIDADPAVRGRIKVLFLPEYCVSLAERLIPASDVSNQISTAGYEASGTSNMKFMMNGALTIGTRDGATIEMAEEAGEENFFLFGLTADQVAKGRDWYNPRWHYDHEPETRAALDLIFTDHFSRHEPGIFASLRDTLLTGGDHYMHLADLKSYLEADQRLVELYADPEGWARKAILNVAGSGKFSHATGHSHPFGGFTMSDITTNAGVVNAQEQAEQAAQLSAEQQAEVMAEAKKELGLVVKALRSGNRENAVSQYLAGLHGLRFINLCRKGGQGASFATGELERDLSWWLGKTVDANLILRTYAAIDLLHGDIMPPPSAPRPRRRNAVGRAGGRAAPRGPLPQGVVAAGRARGGRHRGALGLAARL